MVHFWWQVVAICEVIVYINHLIVIMETHCVFFEVRSEFMAVERDADGQVQATLIGRIL
jgi:hypothetical protein